MGRSVGARNACGLGKRIFNRRFELWIVSFFFFCVSPFSPENGTTVNSLAKVTQLPGEVVSRYDPEMLYETGSTNGIHMKKHLKYPQRLLASRIRFELYFCVCVNILKNWFLATGLAVIWMCLRVGTLCWHPSLTARLRGPQLGPKV